MGWAGQEAGCLQLWGSGLSSPRRALRQAPVSRGPSTSGGDQVVRGKVGRGAGSERGKKSGVVPVQTTEREENRQEKIQGDWTSRPSMSPFLFINRVK